MKNTILCIALTFIMILGAACQAQQPVTPAPPLQTPSATPLPAPLDTLGPLPTLELLPTPASNQEATPASTATETTKPAKTPAKPGVLAMAMAKAAYTPDSAELVATIKNNSPYTYTFGEASYLQQKLDGKWKTVPFSEDVAWIEIAYILEPSQSKEIKLSLSLFNELGEETYRLVKNVTRQDGKNESVSAEFRIEESSADISGLRFTTKSSKYPPTGEVKAVLKNETKYVCTFGEPIYLQKKSGASWVDVPFKEDMAWIAIAYLLNPGESKEVSLSLSLFKPLEEGSYRLVKDVTYGLGNGEYVNGKTTAAFSIVK